MGVHGGRYGVLSGIGAVRNWQINDEQNAAVFVNSATGAGTGRRPGISSWTGGYQEHGAQPGVMPGLTAAFAGYTSPTTDVLGTNGQKFTGNIISESCSILWDWAGGQVLSSQSQFSGTGLLAYSVTSALTDTSVSDPEPVGVTKITYQVAAGGTETTIANIAQASLNFTNSVQPYANSSTNSQTGRAPGITDWNASLNIQDDLIYGGMTKGTAYIFKFYTTATLFYQLKWGLVISATNLVVSEETGAIIGYTLNLGMNGTQNIAGTPTLGNIKLPDTSTYWGV